MILLTTFSAFSRFLFPRLGHCVGHLWLAVRHHSDRPFVRGRGPHGGLGSPCFVLPCLVLTFFLCKMGGHTGFLTPTAFPRLSATGVICQWFCINDSVTQCMTSFSRLGVQLCVIHKGLVWPDLGAAIGSQKDGLQIYESRFGTMLSRFHILDTLASMRVPLSKPLAYFCSISCQPGVGHHDCWQNTSTQCGVWRPVWCTAATQPINEGGVTKLTWSKSVFLWFLAIAQSLQVHYFIPGIQNREWSWTNNRAVNCRPGRTYICRWRFLVCMTWNASWQKSCAYL